MHKKLSLTAIVAAATLSSGAAFALPVAQLDIVGSATTYDPVTETVITKDPNFSLYAYGNTPNIGGKDVDLSLNWYVSIAITPKIAPSAASSTNFGSFSVDGTSYDSSDFVFGTPPLESLLSYQAMDLQKHGIFDTLYMVLGVNWDTTQTRSAVDVQTTQGSDPYANPGNALMFVGWDFDVSGLLAGYNLHFDLFGVDCSDSTFDTTKCAVLQFAPFSHDAQTSVPEPAAITLLGFGLLVLGASVRRSRRKQMQAA